MPTTQKPKQTKATQKVGGKSSANKAKVPAKIQGGGDQCTIQNICDNCESVDRLPGIIENVINLDLDKLTPDDKKQLLSAVTCLKDKVKKRPLLFHENGEKLTYIINRLNKSLLTKNKSLPRRPLHGTNLEGKICDLTAFGNKKCDNLEICVYSPSVVTAHVAQIENQIKILKKPNSIDLNSIDLNSMSKTLNCLYKFIANKGNINDLNSPSLNIYYRVENALKNIKNIKEQENRRVRKENTRNQLPPISQGNTIPFNSQKPLPQINGVITRQQRYGGKVSRKTTRKRHT